MHFTYVHGDFRPANIIFNELKEKYYLVDFENFMVGDSFLDVYKMLSVLKSISAYNFEDVSAFLDGYSSVRVLPTKIVDMWNSYCGLIFLMRMSIDSLFTMIKFIIIFAKSLLTRTMLSFLHIIDSPFPFGMTALTSYLK